MQAQSTPSRTRIPKAGFGQYLRTGIFEWPDTLEVKFNPWHDPQTGRFTFRGGGGGSGGGGGASGSWQGGGFTGGGGGSFSGAGASSTEPWGGPTRPRPQPVSPPRTSPKVLQGSVSGGAASSPQQAPAPHSVTRAGYTYQLDAADRTTQVTGTLTLNPTQSRSRSSQAGAGGTDRLPTDDGGHYVAARFNGPTDTFNHFAQNANFNRGGYRVLENEWAKDTRQGKTVYVKITPGYSGASKRPNTINIVFTVNGSLSKRAFSNTPKGKHHGK